MRFMRKLKITYHHLEHLHHHYGLALHGTVFMFSLLIGISIGLLLFLISSAEAKRQMSLMKSYENRVMSQLVKKIEAAPFAYPTKK